MKWFFLIFLVNFATPLNAQEVCQLLSNRSRSEISERCLHQLDLVCNNISVLWQMFDASSKYPYSGMSYSNNRDLGNFDQCVNLNYEAVDGTVKGKYCGLSVAVVNLFLPPIPNPYRLEIKRKSLAQNENVAISYVTSPDLRTLQRDLADEVSLSVLSVCVPDQCTPEEAGKFFIWSTIQFNNISLVNFVPTPCVTKESNSDFEVGDVVFIGFLALIGLLIIWCTAYDFVIQKYGREPDHPILLSFSLITNGKKFLHISSRKNPDQIQCLNGMRFISMMWIISGHNFIAFESLPLINYAEIKGMIDDVSIQYASAAPIAVDTFFFLSGFLLAFSFFKSAVKTTVTRQIMGIPMMIVHRYIRLTPALAVLYFVSITIFRKLGLGPLWLTVSQNLNRQCRDHWWSFFLYVQNYVDYDDMCLNHSWYLSADMQMFILAPLVLIPVGYLAKNKKTNLAIWGLLGLICVTVVFPMAIRFADHSIANVYDTHSRFNDYLIGVLLGLIMRTPRFQRFPFHKLVNLGIWCFVFVADVCFIIVYHSIIRVYEHTSDTLFYGLYRPIWCFSLAWMVYSCYHGYGGPINWLLSLPMFQVGARLSYCMYLLHAVVEMYWVGLIRTPYYWQNYQVFYVWCGHFIVTMLLSFVWSLAFESPMIVIEKCIFGNAGRRKPEERHEAKQGNV